MIVKRIVFLFLFLSVLFVVFPQEQNEIQENKNLILEKLLSEYYENDLQIKDITVKIHADTVAIVGTPDFKDKWNGTGQIVLAIAGAGVIVPDSKKIVFIIHFSGMPVGFIEVPTRKALLVSEGKMSEKDFITSFISTRLSLPIKFPEDLLSPIIGSSDIWRNIPVIVCNAVRIGELLNVDVEEFLPEFLEAAYVKTDSSDGSEKSVVAVVDLVNESDAKEFQRLNDRGQSNMRIVRIGTVVYILKGNKDVLKKCLSVINPEPEQKIIKEEVKKGDLPINESVENKKDTKGYYIIGGGFVFLFLILVFIFILSGKGKTN